MKWNRRKMDGSVARTSWKSEGLKDYWKVSRTGEKGKMLEGKKRQKKPAQKLDANTLQRQIHHIKYESTGNYKQNTIF